MLGKSPATSVPANTKITVKNDWLYKFQKWHAILITNVVPFLGFVAGVVLIAYWGFGWFEIIIFSSMYLLSVIGLEVGFHRLFTHRSFDAVAPLVAFLAITGSFCAQGPLIYWVANHRRHHRHSDKAGDPHSPFVDMNRNKIGNMLKGFWHAHLGWQVDHEAPNTAHFAKDLLKNKLLFKLNKTYFIWVSLGVILPSLIGLLVYGNWQGLLKGMIWGGLARVFVVNQVTFSINSICHIAGSQPFKTGEGSRNNALLAIPTFGQAWHNNHHAFPYSAIVGLKKGQIDLGGLTIKLFEKLKWVSRVKQPNLDQIKQKANKS